MKNIIGLTTIALATVLTPAIAGTYRAQADAGGSSRDFGQSNGIGITVPATATYNYHMYLIGGTGQGGSAYIFFNGGGISVNDSISTYGAKGGNGAFSSAGTVYGAVYAGVNSLNDAAESGLTITW